MKKLILFSFFFSLCFILNIQKSSGQYDDNGYHVSDPKYQGHYSLKQFNYNNLWYPVIDSVAFKYYGKEEYAKSFGAYGEAFSVSGNKFSKFFLTKEKVKYVTYLHNGYLYNDKEPVVLKKENSYMAFFLFFILFPVVVYLMGENVDMGKFKPYYMKRNFSFLFFSFFVALCFKFLLYDLFLNPLKIDISTIERFFGSKLILGFFAYLFIHSTFTYIFRGFAKFVFVKLPVIFLGAILAGISFGFAFEEIQTISAGYLLGWSFVVYVILTLFSIFKDMIKSQADGW